MKNFLLALFLLSVPLVAIGQNKAMNKFYRQHKRGEDVRNAKLPGFLIRMGGKMAIKRSDMNERDIELAKNLIKKAGGIKFMYSEEGAEITEEDIQELKEGMRDSNFDDLIMIKSEGIDFQLMINEADGVVKNLFLIYNDTEEGEMAFISMKMKVKLDEIYEMVEKGMEEHYHEIMEVEEEPVAAEPMM